MITHGDERVLPFTPEQLYELVADVGAYPKFLPWCSAARILERESDQVFLAELVIRFKGLKSRYTSKVTLKPSEASSKEPYLVETEMVDGPFTHMFGRWEFHPHERGCRLYFHIDFAFETKWFNSLMESVFESMNHTMADAFEKEAYVRFQPIK